MSFCRTCGAEPCTNPYFCAACRRAGAKLADERKAGRQVESADILRARRLLAEDVSLDRIWGELNDRRSHSTPRVTVEAILHCVRARGLSALKEPANIERLARCDAAAKAQIDKRIELELKETCK
jgi:hypothetical protein